ncbi:MAG: hypothetical protein SFY56_16710 [Bacteroidota bacterium]|nr:hypothetical protein [Bacteroidota bacterium]
MSSIYVTNYKNKSYEIIILSAVNNNNISQPTTLKKELSQIN